MKSIKYVFNTWIIALLVLPLLFSLFMPLELFAYPFASFEMLTGAILLFSLPGFFVGCVMIKLILRLRLSVEIKFFIWISVVAGTIVGSMIFVMKAYALSEMLRQLFYSFLISTILVILFRFRYFVKLQTFYNHIHQLDSSGDTETPQLFTSTISKTT